jgi:Mor family transcriptional regulator
MNYRNGKEVLPPELLKELQKYIHGELVYIPKKEEKRAGWGESNGTRTVMEWRNREIYELYKSGTGIMELTRQYHLSEDSIRKIISKTNKVIVLGRDREQEEMLVAGS